MDFQTRRLSPLSDTYVVRAPCRHRGRGVDFEVAQARDGVVAFTKRHVEKARPPDDILSAAGNIHEARNVGC